jgi:hypothetical protein
MKLAVISDTHFGDDTSRLATTAGLDASGFDRFAAAAGTGNDYLVLLGDVFDFSIAGYAKTYEVARTFFTAVRRARLAREVIYLPGNHDFTSWHLVVHQANVINPIVTGGAPRLRWTVPGLLDARPGADPELALVGVEPRMPRRPGDPKYGGLFLDYLSGIAPQDRLPFNVAFPNLYLIESDGQATLMTHGQYFDPYWSLTLTLSRAVLNGDLVLGGGIGSGADGSAGGSAGADGSGPGADRSGTPTHRSPTIDDIVTVNFPLNELASSGLGQAGPLTDNIRRIQVDAKSGDLTRIRRYVERARDFADRSLTFTGPLAAVKELVSDTCLDQVAEAILEAVKSASERRGTRENGAWLAQPTVRANLVTYLEACLLETRAIEERTGRRIPNLTKLIFGHTHVTTAIGPAPGAVAVADGWAQAIAAPIPLRMGTTKLAPLPSGTGGTATVKPVPIPFGTAGDAVRAYNTGGWLQTEQERAEGRPIGAAVFRFDSSTAERWWAVKM